MNSKRQIGARIEKFRKGQSQKPLAVQAFKDAPSENAAQVRWSKIETGKQDATIEDLFNIARVLHVRFEDLIIIEGASDRADYFSYTDTQFKKICDSIKEIFKSNDEDVIQALALNVREFKKSVERDQRLNYLERKIKDLESKGPNTGVGKKVSAGSKRKGM